MDAKRKATGEGGEKRKKTKLQLSHMFMPLHSAFWKKSIADMLRQTTMDSTTLDYLPRDLLVELDLYILNFTDPLLLIREEYRTALKTLNSWKKPPIKGVVVTGYPGIGKTYFLFYVLFQRLSKGLPTAVQYNTDDFVLFTDEGPTEHDGRHIFSFPIGTWALSDSNEAVMPCFAFRRSRPNVFVLQTTSPQASRYKEWQKQRMGVRTYVMECITVAELKSLAKLNSYDPDQVEVYYNDWGPSAHTCLNLTTGAQSITALETKASRAAQRFVTTNRDLPPLEDYNPEDVSNVLFSIHPVGDSREVMTARVATEHLLDIILAKVSWLDAVGQSQFFNMISGHPWLKSPLGNFYEKLMHVRLTADPAARPLPCTSSANVSVVSLPVVPHIVSLSGSSNLKDANKNTLPFYWQPVSPTFTSLDAIICTMENVFLIQTTVSSKYNIKKQDLEFIRDNVPPAFWKARKCHLVFVTPYETNAACLRTPDFSGLKDLSEVQVHSCVVPIGTSTFTTSQLNSLRKLDVRTSPGLCRSPQMWEVPQM